MKALLLSLVLAATVLQGCTKRPEPTSTPAPYTGEGRYAPSWYDLDVDCKPGESYVCTRVNTHTCIALRGCPK